MPHAFAEIQKAAELYRDGGKMMRIFHGESATYIYEPSLPASGEGKARVEAFLGFFDDIKKEAILSKQEDMFFALIQTLLNSSSTVLKRDVCEVVLNSGYAELKPNPSVKAVEQVSAWLRSQTKTADYQLFFMRYSPIINKPGFIDQAASFFRSLTKSKRRRATEDPESTHAAGTSVMAVSPTQFY